MDTVIPIHTAKATLSKLVKEAQEGAIVYIGAYGQPQAMLSPIPHRSPVNIGVWDHRKTIDYEALEASDEEIAAWLEGEV